MNDDVPFERDGERISLKRLEITCYEFVEHKEARPQIKEGVRLQSCFEYECWWR